MDSGFGSQYRGPVVDLVDPYTTKETATEAVEKLEQWLYDHPGRWAMISDGEFGVDKKNLAKDGFSVAQRTTTSGSRRAYASLPHPEGEPLDIALARTVSIPTYSPDLPELSRDTFEWTKEELETACAAARGKLFPEKAARGRGRRT